ncbi:MAG: hypothetical protein UR23_C0042G0004 [Candidatus Roizmanbacteria bacterium GW2011_GWA2_32_13]|uniref:Uncharacterized protein n=1 Tax=Candidatus Roizmanbacteria bacterium GW2011_GWA2_32_13 TaxID=1618475 RepID=A0A0G0BQU4_9BACT|nr:MAG: hypothetical protein UR23_C0042G0004 [Candidatus Roizmanbacteria bacterium GW2011_GWA2_32_13]
MIGGDLPTGATQKDAASLAPSKTQLLDITSLEVKKLTNVKNSIFFGKSVVAERRGQGYGWPRGSGLTITEDLKAGSDILGREIIKLKGNDGLKLSEIEMADSENRKITTSFYLSKGWSSGVHGANPNEARDSTFTMAEMKRDSKAFQPSDIEKMKNKLRASGYDTTEVLTKDEHHWKHSDQARVGLTISRMGRVDKDLGQLVSTERDLGYLALDGEGKIRMVQPSSGLGAYDKERFCGDTSKGIKGEEF